jgi:hypothetical protein
MGAWTACRKKELTFCWRHSLQARFTAVLRRVARRGPRITVAILIIVPASRALESSGVGAVGALERMRQSI